jgi:hypothetical protein
MDVALAKPSPQNVSRSGRDSDIPRTIKLMPLSLRFTPYRDQIDVVWERPAMAELESVGDQRFDHRLSGRTGEPGERQTEAEVSEKLAAITLYRGDSVG